MTRFRNAVVSIGLLCAMAPALMAAENNAETLAASLQSKANRLYQDGRLNEALPLYQRLSRIRPHDLVILKNLMWISWKTGDKVGAADAASRVTALAPDDIESWNLLAQASDASGHWQDAIHAYRKELALEPQNDGVRMALARLYINIKDNESAIAMFDRVAKRKPNSVEAYAALAQIYFFQGSYDQSLENWHKALALKPTNLDYQFGEAKTVYYSGKPIVAIDQMKHILATQPDNQEVSNFLTDDALASGDLRFAQELLNSRLTEFRQQDEMRIMQLTDVLQSRGQWDQSLSVLKRYLNVNTNNGQPLLRMGDALNHVHRSTEAVTYYKRVIDMNPYSIRALIGLADSYINLSRQKEALDTFRRARALDPTNPTLILRLSQTLYDAHDFEGSRKLLTDWVNEQSEPVLPILLYHGLTPYQRDPLLAYSVHMSTSAFEDQMKSVHEAGYTPVTVAQVHAWYAQHTPLPKHPILIAFDDARMDAFQYADPILAHYSLRATMFAPTREVDENFPGNASWDELKRYAQTQRWEIQSHGDRAHDHVLIDADGRLGIFLPNKIWFPNENRLETLDEWRTRIDADHERSVRKIKEHLGTPPVALAWPEGDFGQDSVSNDPNAVPVNIEMARRHFSLAFQEDEFGLNLRSHDPMLLFRLQPKHMTGKELVHYLEFNNPIARAHRILFQHAVWEDRLAEAHHWFKALHSDGVEDSVLLVEEARLQKAGGQDEKAVLLAKQALLLDDSADNRHFLADMLTQNKGGWNAGLLYQHDNQKRESLSFEQSVDVAKTGSLRWTLLQHFGRYLEPSAKGVNDLGGGVSALWTLKKGNALNFRLDGHAFSRPVKNEVSVQGQWNAQWPQGWSTQLEGSRVPYDSARAIDAGVIDRFGRATAQWQDPGIWRFGISGAAHDLSDRNNRYAGWAEVDRNLGGPMFQIIGRSSFDRMNRLNPNYYSPQNLQMYQGGLEFSKPWGQNNHVRLRYLPGIGKEDGTTWQLAQELTAGVSASIGRLTVEPTYVFYRTPTYSNNSYFLSLGFPF